MSQSVRNKKTDFLAKKLLGDSFQPAALFNVPYSFLEGAVYTQDEKNQSGLLYDNWNLQLMMQAKVENKFPSLIQVSGAMDVYPENDLCFAAAAAFYAYIQQKYGIQKFCDYWNECGKINFFKLDRKIFEKEYEVSLSDLWNEFIESIPYPDINTNLKVNSFLKTDYDSNYKFIVSTNYGLVWYDELKKEVDISGIYNFESQRQLLFLASDITNLTVSPCGRFLVISHIQSGTRAQFQHDIVHFYDLKERRFLTETYNLRDASIVVLADGKYAVAGNFIQDDYSCLQVYCSGELNELLGYNNSQKNIVYTKNFDYGVTPFCTVPLKENYFASLVCHNNEWFVFISSIQNQNETTCSQSEKFFKIKNICDNQDSSEYLKIRNLRFANIDGESCLLFDYVLQNICSLTRPGIIYFDENLNPKKITIESEDISGGMSCTVMYNKNLHYIVKMLNHSEIKYSNIQNLTFEEASFEYYNEPENDDYTTVQIDNFILQDYSPWKYMINGSWKFFMPVRDITLEEGLIKQPGLGVVFETQADPFSNNQLIISVANGFIPLDFTTLFNATKKSNDELTAKKIELNKDSAAALYYKNTSTPADFIVSSIFKFNDAGEYTFNAIGNIHFEVPLLMTFRRLSFDAAGIFTASTSYWDALQMQNFPTLQDWPSFDESYRKVDCTFSAIYSNIHKYGISELKKIGVSGGAKITSSWTWGEINPFQINAGLFATGEIPFLIPVQNYNNWILSLPSTIHAELFYTNGKAVRAYAQTLISGMEIQNGFWRIYFPRFGLYCGYDVALEYDTVKVKLPDLRAMDRFYNVFENCTLNDSFYLVLNFDVTPVVGKFSTFQLNTNLRLDKYIQSDEYKLQLNFQIKY